MVVCEGMQGLGKGLFDGVTGLVRKPVEGAMKDGVGGFAKGIAQVPLFLSFHLSHLPLSFIFFSSSLSSSLLFYSIILSNN